MKGFSFSSLGRLMLAIFLVGPLVVRAAGQAECTVHIRR